MRPDGLDEVEFFFSANPGEPARPLAKVASGGEASRLLLALKRALADSDACGCYILDEADAGVSGTHFFPRRREEVVGGILRRTLGRHGLARRLDRHIPAAVWADAVGAELAARAH